MKRGQLLLLNLYILIKSIVVGKEGTANDCTVCTSSVLKMDKMPPKEKEVIWDMISDMIVRQKIRGDGIQSLHSLDSLLKSLSHTAEAIPICREGVARRSQRVNEARPRVLSHPATAADPGPDYCNERELLIKCHYISTYTHTCTD